MDSKDIPSWLQAFAAIVALGMSYFAIRQANAVEKRRDRLKSHAIAVAIYPDLLKLDIIIGNVNATLQSLKTNNRVLVGQTIGHTVQGGQIEIPPMLDRNVDNLYLLGEPAGPNCLQLVSILTQYNDLVGEVAAHIMIMNAGQWVESVEHLEAQLTLISNVVAKCKASVKARGKGAARRCHPSSSP